MLAHVYDSKLDLHGKKIYKVLSWKDKLIRINITKHITIDIRLYAHEKLIEESTDEKL